MSLLIFCNNHMIHHRGQLALTLRPMGAERRSTAAASTKRAERVPATGWVSLAMVLAGIVAVPGSLRVVTRIPAAVYGAQDLPS